MLGINSSSSSIRQAALEWHDAPPAERTGDGGGAAAGHARRWWKEGVAYQVYFRSFCDSNGDGIGDIGGLIGKLDYLQQLGITMLWVTPFYKSPNRDNGYDISDYYAVDPLQGSLADVDRLVRECHSRSIRLILDMVVNHTSHEHPWFVESRSSRANPKREYYFWRPGRDGREPNNWSAGFSPSAWEFDETSGEYYLHYYSVHMPDLNWSNPEVREQIYAMMRWWLDRGIDGLRLDSINLISKNELFLDARTPDPAAPGYFYDPDLIYNQPGLIGLLQDMRCQVFDGRDIVTIGETSVTPAEVAAGFVLPENRALDLVFNFEPVEMEVFDLVEFKRIQSRWYRIIEQGGWTAQYLSNHDQARQVSRFGDDRNWRERSAKLLALMLHGLPGTPFIYQGEEIGMTNSMFGSIEEHNDVATINRFNSLVGSGMPPAEALERVRDLSRDNARTPMQWNSGQGAGFSTGKPWLAINPNYREVNVASELSRPDSVLHFYQRLVALRNANPVMVYGDFTDHCPDHPVLYCFSRRHLAVEWLVVLNLSGESIETALPGGGGGELVIATSCSIDPRKDCTTAELGPWEGFVLARNLAPT